MVNFSSILFTSFQTFLFSGTLNPDEDCKQAENYLRSRLSSQPNLTYNPRKQQRLKMDQIKRDELARHYMYTSVQQAAFDEVPWGKII